MITTMMIIIITISRPRGGRARGGAGSAARAAPWRST